MRLLALALSTTLLGCAAAATWFQQIDGALLAGCQELTMLPDQGLVCAGIASAGLLAQWIEEFVAKSEPLHRSLRAVRAAPSPVGTKLARVAGLPYWERPDVAKFLNEPATNAALVAFVNARAKASVTADAGM
jgi:hypothetical protein